MHNMYQYSNFAETTLPDPRPSVNIARLERANLSRIVSIFQRPVVPPNKNMFFVTSHTHLNPNPNVLVTHIHRIASGTFDISRMVFYTWTITRIYLGLISFTIWLLTQKYYNQGTESQCVYFMNTTRKIVWKCGVWIKRYSFTQVLQTVWY